MSTRNTSRDGKRRLRANAAHRRGAAVGLLLVTVLFLGAFCAVAVNVSRLGQIQSQLRATCQAAALSGAAELMDESILSGRFDLRDDVSAAREASLRTAKCNVVDGRKVTLDPNLENRPEGDVVVGLLDPSSKHGSRLALPADARLPLNLNTVRVTARMERNVYTRVSLWLGSLTGITTSDVACTAQATIDRRVAGFRPEPGVKIPVVPFVAEYDGWMRDALREAVATQNDLFSVNEKTGEVTAGPDGIAEIVLLSRSLSRETASDVQTACEDPKPQAEAASEGEPTSEAVPPAAVVPFAALGLVTSADSANIDGVRCREGLSRDDLACFGGEMVIRDAALFAPITGEFPAELVYGLTNIIGQSRSWPLAEFDDGDHTACRIVGFGAARIVAVRRLEEPAAGWEIVVQPTVLVSSQAVADPRMHANPWIAKLELTESP